MKKKNKLGQWKKSKFSPASLISSRKAQEEMVGFALIIILVAIILLVFLSSSLKKSQQENVEDYEVNSFIQSFLQYTTECEKNSENLPIQRLIFECEKEARCDDESDSCEVLSTTLKEIIEESWAVGEENPVKGYELEILSNGQQVLPLMKEGEETTNYKTSVQDFAKSGDLVEIFFTAYY